MLAEFVETLRCYGYHGFGSGFEMASNRRLDRREGLYCSRACSVGQACWEVHRRRVLVLFPAIESEFNKLSETMRGPPLVEEWRRRFGTAPPAVTVLTGNVEDGARVAKGKRPKDRGDASLTWPLTALSSSIIQAEGE